jgi:phage shock protein PspC (stress-responsive transcriptional regulator)
MKTTININISGMAFVIDQDAYQQLETYLNNIKARIKDQAEAKEVVDDIEGRIAEIFRSRLNKTSEVISLENVNDVIRQMGRPEDIFMEEEGDQKSEAEAPKEAPNKNNRYTTYASTRRLYRNSEDKVLSGLMSGMSYYFGIDNPIWMRLAFIVSLFVTSGVSGLIYLILSAVTPEALTASEKLEMRGEDINISNISRTVQTEGAKSSSSTGISRFFEMCMDMLKYCVKAIPTVVAVILLLTAISGLISVCFLLFGGTVINGSKLPDLLFSQSYYGGLALFGAFLVLGIPNIALIYYSLRMLIGSSLQVKGIGWGFLFFFVVGSVIIAFVSHKTIREFRESSRSSYHMSLDQVQGDTLMLKGIKHEEVRVMHGQNEFGISTDGLLINSDSVTIDEVNLSIEKADDGKYDLLSVHSAKGLNDEQARLHGNHITHDVRLDSNQLFVSDVLSFPKKDRWRNQKVSMVLKMPVGKVVYLDNSVKHIIYDIDNVTNTYDGDMVGHYWKMTAEGLVCLDHDFALEKKKANEEDEDLDIEINDDSTKHVIKKIETIDIHGSGEEGKSNIKMVVVEKDGEKKKVIIKDGGMDGAEMHIEKIEK